MNTDDAGRADLWPNAELVFIWVCGVLGYYAHAEKTTMSGKDLRLEATEHPNHHGFWPAEIEQHTDLL